MGFGAAIALCPVAGLVTEEQSFVVGNRHGQNGEVFGMNDCPVATQPGNGRGAERADPMAQPGREDLEDLDQGTD